jgi:hypothetical protein
LVAFLAVAAGLVGCSSTGSQSDAGPASLDATASDDSVSTTDSGGAIASDVSFAADAGSPMDGASSVDDAGPPFPNGGRQYKTIANLVDPALVQAIEVALTDTSGAKDYSSVTQAFYGLYPDEYDFLYFFLDHQVPNATAEAAFDVVNRPVIPGTGIDTAVAHTTFGSRGRLRGATAFQAPTDPNAFPAIAHETAHYWAAYLDHALGFGKDRDTDYGPHWGIVGVYGQLGGFDPKAVSCLDPQDAAPPGCKLDPMIGAYSYIMSAFAPNSNTFLGIPYAPLELYMMGLLTQTDLPTSFSVVQNARFNGLIQSISLVEGSGIGAIAMSDIVARHGVRAPAADSDKHFAAAFVVVSVAPEPDAMLDRVVTWQQFWGGDVPANGGEMSFAQATGGRATMTTRIGRRRTSADPPPLPPM